MPCHGNHTVSPVQGTVRSESELSPAHNTKGKVVDFTPVKITDLPGAMRKMGWDRAAQVMQKWLEGKAFHLTAEKIKLYSENPAAISADICDETTVTMEWALGYPRVREVYDKLLQAWCSPAARQEIVAKLQKQNWPSTLGKTSDSARILHATCQVQYAPFGSVWDTIDEMYGLIGEASFYLAVVGHFEIEGVVWVKEKKKSMFLRNFLVTDIGIYIRDVYEFNRFQFLGIWTKEKTYGKAEIISTVGMNVATSHPSMRAPGMIIHGIKQIAEPFSPVFNHNFREYRQKTGKGRDMFIFSDVKWEKPKGGPIAIPVLTQISDSSLPILV